MSENTHPIKLLPHAQRCTTSTTCAAIVRVFYSLLKGQLTMEVFIICTGRRGLCVSLCVPRDRIRQKMILNRNTPFLKAYIINKSGAVLVFVEQMATESSGVLLEE